MFTIDVLTLFPEVFAPFVGLSIVGRAVEAKIAALHYHHLLDELHGGERADGAPVGGGAGMVLRLEPIARVAGPRFSKARRTASGGPSSCRRRAASPSVKPTPGASPGWTG